MHVLYVEHQQAGSILGGAEIQSRKTAQRLLKMGIKITFTNTESIDLDHKYDLIHYFNIIYHDDLYRIVDFANSSCTPLVISPIYFDFTHYLFALSPRSQWLIKWIGRKISFHLYQFRYEMKTQHSSGWKAQKVILEQAKAILPNSYQEGNYLLDHFKLQHNKQSKIFVIPLGVDEDLFSEKPQPNKKFLQKHGLHEFILQVGAISRLKNQSGLIESLFDLPLDLVFIGPIIENDYYNHCQNLARQRGRTLFLERIPHEELPSIYATAIAHVLPSWHETVGLVSLEAAAAGCRVITTEFTCINEYLKDAAWYCRPDDSKSLYSAVTKAITSPVPIGLREHILKHYTWMIHAKKTYQAYKSVLNL